MHFSIILWFYRRLRCYASFATITIWRWSVGIGNWTLIWIIMGTNTWHTLHAMELWDKVLDLSWSKEDRIVLVQNKWFDKTIWIHILFQIISPLSLKFSFNWSLFVTITLQLPRGKVVTNSNSSLWKFLNYLKVCNSGGSL